jgi:hypothetical protein
MLEANHDGLHTNDDIQWRGYSGLSHEGSWSYMKIFEVPQMNKDSESTQGNLDDVWHERSNCEKAMQATDH